MPCLDMHLPAWVPSEPSNRPCTHANPHACMAGSAKYAFKLWSDDEYFGRLFFNPNGPDPLGAADVAAARWTRFADVSLP